MPPANLGAFCAGRFHRTEHAFVAKLLGSQRATGSLSTPRRRQSVSDRAEGGARSSASAAGRARRSAAADADRPGLHELGIAWIAAHSPQAKGRIERSFHTAQDRLVKELRVAGVSTLEQANSLPRKQFLPWWNQHLVVGPANPADAHRKLGQERDIISIFSQWKPASRQRLHDSTRRQALSDRAANRFVPVCAALPCASRSGWTACRTSVSRTLSGGQDLRRRRPRRRLHPNRPRRVQATRLRHPSPAMRARWMNFCTPRPPTWAAGQIDRTRTPDRIED